MALGVNSGGENQPDPTRDEQRWYIPAQNSTISLEQAEAAIRRHLGRITEVAEVPAQAPLVTETPREVEEIDVVDMERRDHGPRPKDWQVETAHNGQVVPHDLDESYRFVEPKPKGLLDIARELQGRATVFEAKIVDSYGYPAIEFVYGDQDNEQRLRFFIDTVFDASGNPVDIRSDKMAFLDKEFKIKIVASYNKTAKGRRGQLDGVDVVLVSEEDAQEQDQNPDEAHQSALLLKAVELQKIARAVEAKIIDLDGYPAIEFDHAGFRFRFFVRDLYDEEDNLIPIRNEREAYLDKTLPLRVREVVVGPNNLGVLNRLDSVDVQVVVPKPSSTIEDGAESSPEPVTQEGTPDTGSSDARLEEKIELLTVNGFGEPQNMADSFDEFRQTVTNNLEGRALERIVFINNGTIWGVNKFEFDRDGNRVGIGVVVLDENLNKVRGGYGFFTSDRLIKLSEARDIPWFKESAVHAEANAPKSEMWVAEHLRSSGQYVEATVQLVKRGQREIRDGAGNVSRVDRTMPGVVIEGKEFVINPKQRDLINQIADQETVELKIVDVELSESRPDGVYNITVELKPGGSEGQPDNNDDRGAGAPSPDAGDEADEASASNIEIPSDFTAFENIGKKANQDFRTAASRPGQNIIIEDKAGNRYLHHGPATSEPYHFEGLADALTLTDLRNQGYKWSRRIGVLLSDGVEPEEDEEELRQPVRQRPRPPRDAYPEDDDGPIDLEDENPEEQISDDEGEIEPPVNLNPTSEGAAGSPDEASMPAGNGTESNVAIQPDKLERGHILYWREESSPKSVLITDERGEVIKEDTLEPETMLLFDTKVQDDYRFMIADDKLDSAGNEGKYVVVSGQSVVADMAEETQEPS